MIRWYIIDDVLGVVPSDAQGFENYCRRTKHPRHVARTELANGIVVSTILLGLDQAIPGIHDEAEIFESMARLGGHFFDDLRRYPDWPSAAKGHLEMVAEYEKRRPGG